MNGFINGHKLCKKAGGGQSRHVRSRGDTATIAENGGSEVLQLTVYSVKGVL